jgi:hypothetical protein
VLLRWSPGLSQGDRPPVAVEARQQLVGHLDRRHAAREDGVRPDVDQRRDPAAVLDLGADDAERREVTHPADQVTAGQAGQPVLEEHQLGLLGDDGAGRVGAVGEDPDHRDAVLLEPGAHLAAEPGVAVGEHGAQWTSAAEQLPAGAQLLVHARNQGCLLAAT